MQLALLLILLAEGLPSPGLDGSHQAWAKQIRSSRSHAIEAAFATWDAYAREHPADAVAAVERCKLIVALAPGEDEDPDPALPGFRDCLAGLEAKFPDSAVAVGYRLGQSYGAQAISLGEKALANPRIAWTDAGRGRAWAKIAEAQRGLRQLDAAASSARKAMRLDPSTDLTALVGEALLKQNRPTEAVVVLSSRPEGSAFELQQKARHLADARWFFRARWMLDVARTQPGFTPDAMLQARIFEQTGDPQLARDLYAKERTAWNKPDALLRLLRLELASGSADRAARAYQEFRDQGWNVDPLARYRLALLRKAPGAKWRGRDLLGVLALFGSILGLALVPMLGFLPLHAWSLWRRVRQPSPPDPPGRAQWWFRHLYLVSALLLIAQFVAMYTFDYDQLALWATSQQTPDSAATAAFGLAYAIGLPALLALLLASRPERLRLLGPGTWSLRKCVGQAALSMLAFYAVALASMQASKLLPAVLTVDGLIRSVAKTYGVGVALFAFAVLVPIGEELIFRSIFLDVLSRHVRFWKANTLQALIFAALHGDPARLIPFTTMGLLSGRMRRNSGGLLASILFHAANNALAVFITISLGIGGVPKPEPPPGPELLRCAKSPPAARGSRVPLRNTLAWTVAIDAASTRPCLLEAEDAVDAALQQLPEVGPYLDTRATVFFRLGRLDEAIDLERAVGDKAPQAIYFSQLARFLRARRAGGGPVLLGEAGAGVKLTLASQDLVVELASPYPRGFVIYAREARSGGMIELAAGPSHEQTHRVHLPSGLANDARFEPELIDARGCDDCSAGWRWHYEPHDTEVDKYP